MKLVMITDHYPYTRGEMPFVLPELAITAQRFSVELICKSPESVHQYTVPYEVPVKHYRSKTTILTKVFNFLGCLADPAYWREIFKKRVDGCSFRKQEAEVRNFRLNAHRFHAYMKQQGYFENCEDTVFYSYWYNYAAYALVLQKKKMPGLKIITRTHGYDLYNQRSSCGRQIFKKEMDPYMDAVFFVSQLGRTYYLEHFATQPEEVYKMAYLGVADHGVSPLNEGKELLLFSCSNLIPLKRVHLIVEALAELTDLSIHWVHAGGGSEEQALRNQAAGLFPDGSSISYDFLGAVDNQEIIDFYRNHAVDLFITTSETEGGTPVSIMEALSFGIPVIGTAVGGIPEMVLPETGILLFQNPSVHEIASAIRQYYNLSPQEKQALKTGARHLWQKSFCDTINHKKFADELEKLLPAPRQ